MEQDLFLELRRCYREINNLEEKLHNSERELYDLKEKYGSDGFRENTERLVKKAFMAYAKKLFDSIGISLNPMSFWNDNKDKILAAYGEYWWDAEGLTMDIDISVSNNFKRATLSFVMDRLDGTNKQCE